MDNKAVFWDFHGTLQQPLLSWSQQLGEILAARGYSVSKDHLWAIAHHGYSWHDPEKTYPDRTGELWWADVLERQRPHLVALGMSEDEAEAIGAEYRAAMLDSKNYTLYDDAEASLRRCRALGYRNYILSNNFPELEEIIGRLGIHELFDGFAVSACIGYEKPHIEIFNYARKIADSPEVCYMVGDNPKADVAGGKAAGMIAIQVHSSPRAAEADHHFMTLAEIPDMLENKG